MKREKIYPGEIMQKDKKYYFNRLKKFFRNPIEFLKIRKLVDVKLLPNSDGRFVETDSLRKLYGYLLESDYLNVDEFLKESKLLSFSDSESVESLNLLFDKHGSDKGSHHGYTKVYHAIICQQLSTKKDCVIFEIGIGSNNLDVQSNMGIEGIPGASARAFRDFSSKIKLIIGDIDERILFEEERINSYYVDQLKNNTLENFFSISKYDIAIDDGLHSLRSNLNFFIKALDKKTSNSWIVIEDINLSDTYFWQNISDISTHFSDSWVIKLNHSFQFVMYIR